jgi:pimeloyl-ACP methyl ester carboxylesterase
MRRSVALISLIASVAVMATGCAEEAPHRPEAQKGVALNADFSGTGPGTLLAANSLPTIDRRLRAATSTAARVEYTSTSGITNAETRVTGTVFVPRGQAPDAGWPVVALGHPTTGIESDCAPSLSPTLRDQISAVALLVGAGYVVTAPDYQGLGSDENHHPYLDPTTVGYNMIDAVRAARRVAPKVSDRWVALGSSQGGQAAWAVNELAADYGQGLALLGSASLAPPLDLTFLADAAAAGTLTNEQKPPYLSLLATLANEHPDLNLDDYRRGLVKQDWDVLLACDVATADARARMIDQITPDDLRPSSQAATDALRGYLQQMSLPRKAAAAPLLVIYGDRDAFIPVEVTDRALALACGMGDVIDIQRQPEKGHSDLDMSSVLPWITDRFAGLPAVNTCTASPPPTAEVPQEGA